MSSNQKSRSNNRSGRHNNKQNNRGRNQNNRGRKGSSAKQARQPLSANKQVDSHGPGGKVRGNVKQLYDKYKALAHECRTKDRTSSEAYGQFAHHYYTLYSEFAAAEAALQLEREKEKERKQQEAAEEQANVVSLLDEQNSDESIVSAVNDADEDKAEPNDIKPKNKRSSKKKAEAASPELPLADDAEPPAKPKRPRKSKKIKEEVAE